MNSKFTSIISYAKSHYEIIILVLVVVVVLVFISFFVYKKYSKNSKNNTNSTTPSPDNENGITEGATEYGTGKFVQIMRFHTTWCPHCQSTRVDWETIKEKYNGKVKNGYKIEMIDVDCTDETPNVANLMNKYKVEGYPTIILIKDGSDPTHFNAKPTSSALDEFINSFI